MKPLARRGHIYRIDLGTAQPVLGIVVSTDYINDRYQDHITLQVAASRIHENTAGAVRLTSGDPVPGYVICRDTGMVHRDELTEDLGAVCPETLHAVGTALRSVLGL